ncbi:MAG: hypothetical protein PSN37_06185 [Alphaproteobacteria bacterium]|nr:hypothetical protein [Alphaproteobacteria bacterium]
MKRASGSLICGQVLEASLKAGTLDLYLKHRDRVTSYAFLFWRVGWVRIVAGCMKLSLSFLPAIDQASRLTA